MEKIEKKIGKLYIVGTPIGNLGDMTIRAIETLKKVDVILAEDTRNTLKLLNHFNIQKHLVSYHRHNEDEKVNKMTEFLDDGKDLALVSDAGMPIISDPGHSLVKHLIENGYKIEVIPGVTALTTAIVKSGLDSTRFTFEGFLSINKKQRRLRLDELKDETRTMIFYEAPHKLLATLKDMHEYIGDRNICIARELTKLYEEFSYTTIKEAIIKLEENGIRGEIVLILQGRDEADIKSEKMSIINEKNVAKLVEEYIKEGLDKKEAIKKVAKLKNVHKNEIYKECIDLEE